MNETDDQGSAQVFVLAAKLSVAQVTGCITCAVSADDKVNFFGL